MMKVITRIEKFKGKGGYKRVIFNDSSQLDVDNELLLHFGIKEGAEFEEAEIKEMDETASRKIAKDRALEFLRYHSRSVNELKKKLRGLRVKNDVIDEVIDDLKRVGLINDEEYALRFARNYIARKPAGELLLRIELKKKGIENEIIDETVEKIYSEFDKRELIQKLITKKRFNVRSDDRKEKKRIYDYLLRRGFDWGSIGEVMKAGSDY